MSSTYRGVKSAPPGSPAPWRAFCRRPEGMAFEGTDEVTDGSDFLGYFSDEEEAAYAHDQALVRLVGVRDAVKYLNFGKGGKKDNKASENTMKKKKKKKTKKKKKEKKGTSTETQEKSINFVLRMVGKAIVSSRTLYGSKMNDLYKSFKAIDKDNSGHLDANEMASALRRLGLGLTPAQELQVVSIMVSYTSPPQETS